MSELKTEILRSLLECDEYLEGLETSRFKQFGNLLEDLSNKFCDCLPPELQEGFKAIMAIAFTFSCESREIGNAMGLKTAYAIFSLLQDPKTPLEDLMNTRPSLADTNAYDIKALEESIANYKKERKEADT